MMVDDTQNAQAFYGTEDFNEVYDARPKAMAEKPIEVSVVGKRCVYVNDYRICGSKPYVSENLPWHDFTTSMGDVLSAFREEDVLAYFAERKACNEYLAAWRAARDAAEQPR
jgi:hypothetical protein